MWRWLRNLVGKVLGYGHCQGCGDSWLFARKHFIRAYHGQIFPYCEQCHVALSLDQKQALIAAGFALWADRQPRRRRALLNECKRFLAAVTKGA